MGMVCVCVQQCLCCGMGMVCVCVQQCLCCRGDGLRLLGSQKDSDAGSAAAPPPRRMQHIIEQNPDMATALLAGEKLRELILPGQQDDRAGPLAGLLVHIKLELPFDRVVTMGTVLIPIVLVTLLFTRNLAEESIYCYTPHNFTRDQALYARGYCWTELRDAVPGVEPALRRSLFQHKFLPYALLAFAGIMYIPALGWEFMTSTRLTSELNFLLHEIDNCYHRAAEGRAPKIEKQIQSKGPGITERERREIIEDAEKEKSPEQNLFEKYLERRGQSNFLAKLYLARHLVIVFLSSIPISYLSTYYATQRQNEFTCALGEPPDVSSAAPLVIHVNCKLPAVQLQRILSAVDISLLSFINLIILVNLLHLFIVRKSNFIFDKLHKVGIKTKRQWQKSQFCDINILAMFCNENRDHIKSLNRLDFITNESDLMYDNVVRQLLAALAQSNHDTTPTMRDSGIQTVDPSMDPAAFTEGELGVIKRPRKKMKWIPSSNPLPQSFKEPLALMRVENSSKPDKPKPVRRKTTADTLIAPLLESSAKSTQHPPSTKGILSSVGVDRVIEKKHSRHFSLDVHPYMLGTRKPKPEVPIPSPHTQEAGRGHTVVSITDSKESRAEPGFPSQPCRTLPSAVYINGSTSSLPAAASEEPESKGPGFNRNPTHPVLNNHPLYEEEEPPLSTERTGELLTAGQY
ncbi:pannexin-2 isoform X1 [Acipenser ruthenus]|uniref:pannexin-2 isoform X1 n=2 Tax=Acipenser ruthenus TaxID=7906 RepID=UPI0027417DBD|nr:pannexin-2 isoform X1 [Acipenser ruthenus]